jgi:hypothetical protein
LVAVATAQGLEVKRLERMESHRLLHLWLARQVAVRAETGTLTDHLAVPAVAAAVQIIHLQAQPKLADRILLDKVLRAVLVR